MLKFRKIHAWAAGAGSIILVAEGGIRVRAKATQNCRDGYKSKQKINTYHTVLCIRAGCKFFTKANFQWKLLSLVLAKDRFCMWGVHFCICPYNKCELQNKRYYNKHIFSFQPNCVWQKSVHSQERKEPFFTQSYFISLQYTIPIVFCVVKPPTMVQLAVMLVFVHWISVG